LVGLHRVSYGSNHVWVLVFGNVYPPRVKIDDVYDLKVFFRVRFLSILMGRSSKPTYYRDANPSPERALPSEVAKHRKTIR
jgi:hypothetical protein